MTDATDAPGDRRETTVKIAHCDALQALKHLPDASIDAVVCDPPYGLSNTDPAHVVETLTRWAAGERDYVPTGKGFMGKAWDAFVPPPAVWDECLRVLKPGGHLLAFAGSRTFDLMTLSVRFAGFDIRDSIAWLYGSGFPKSRNVGKEVSGFDGWGTALKPAFEPVVVARKPLDGTVAANVLAHGTGALNIDACRVATDDALPGAGGERVTDNEVYGKGLGVSSGRSAELGGRWPANVVLDEHAAAALDEQVGPLTSGKGNVRKESGADRNGNTGAAYGAESRPAGSAMVSYGDSGGASRFFYQAKAPTRERPTYSREDGTRVAHPTVKPVSLMRWLVRLVTPPGGTVLDPFAGSGATVEAALAEGFDVLAVEREADYLPLIQQRIDRVKKA